VNFVEDDNKSRLFSTHLRDIPADAELAEEHAFQQIALVVLLAVVFRGVRAVQHGTRLVERVVAPLHSRKWTNQHLA